MPTITNSLATVSSGTTLLALSLIAGVSCYYLFHDKRFSLSERLYFLICKRNIQEALLEHELLQERNDLQRAQTHMDIDPRFFIV